MADSKSPAAPRLPILLTVSCSAAWVISQLSYNALPQLLGPIKVAFSRSDAVVTRMYGYELFVFAIVALVAAGPLARLSRVLVALLGGAIALTAGVISDRHQRRRSGFEMLAAFPLSTGVICIILLMRVLRRFGSNRKASLA